MSRRARITPEQAGLPYVGGNRRVKGLRREEVAMLAGLSVEYYTRMERGQLGGASESVLDAIARALKLDDDVRAHLYDLARSVAPGSRRKRPKRTSPLTASVQQVLDSMSVPAVVQNGRLDLLAANDLGRALYADLFDMAQQPPNFARYVFLDPRAENFVVVHRDGTVGPASTRSNARSSNGSPGTTKNGSTPHSTTYHPPSTNATTGEDWSNPRSPPESRPPDSTKLGALQRTCKPVGWAESVLRCVLAAACAVRSRGRPVVRSALPRAER